MALSELSEVIDKFNLKVMIPETIDARRKISIELFACPNLEIVAKLDFYVVIAIVEL